MMKQLFFWIVSLVSALGMGQEQKDIRLLFPEADFLSAWTIKDSIEVYSGDNLFNYINGGADIYFEYGFNEVATARYINYASNNIHVDVYKMSDINAAYGIFTLNSSAKGVPLELGDQSYRYDYYLDVWKGPYFMRFTTNRKENGMMDTLLIYSKFIVSQISLKGKKPQLTTAFRLPGIEIKQVKYFKGSIALNNIFNFGHSSIAGFQEGIYGRWEDKRLFVFLYPDQRERREWFASAKGKMQMNRKFSNYTIIEDGFIVADKSGTYFSFKPYSKYILVVKGMDWEDSKKIFDPIQSNLDNF
jgi:hypothetical protein